MRVGKEKPTPCGVCVCVCEGIITTPPEQLLPKNMLIQYFVYGAALWLIHTVFRASYIAHAAILGC